MLCYCSGIALHPGLLLSIPGSASGFLHDLGLLTHLHFALVLELQHGNLSLPVVPHALLALGRLSSQVGGEGKKRTHFHWRNNYAEHSNF